MGSNELGTERTRLRPFAPSLCSELRTLFRNPGVRRYLLDDQLVDKSWIDREVDTSQRRFEEGGLGLWSVHGLDDRLLGFAGFRPFFEPPRLQLLYGLLPEHWGHGLAVEAATAVVDYAFDVVGHTVVGAAIDVPNVASARVLERLGMTPDDTAPDLPHTAFYSLEREVWRARRAGP